MRLLAVDTATEICGVALSVDDRIRAQVVLGHGETHTRHIMAAIESVLVQAGVALSGVDAFAVTQGPGSFTGLRIGISTVKGLAVATGKPIVGVSTLAALARQAEGQSELVCPLIDARRSEVYWSLYKRGKSGLQVCLPESVGPADQIPLTINASCLFIGNGVPLYQHQLQKGIDHPVQWAQPNQNVLQPSVVAHLGFRKLADGGGDDVMTFGPVYLRKSDAEINRQKNRLSK